MRMIIAQAREKDARARASGVLCLRTPPSPAPPGGLGSLFPSRVANHKSN